jgi:selenocysteine lyase/cysteine desulfurase
VSLTVTDSQQLDTLPCQRELFDIPHGITYLNCAYLGPHLRAATKAGLEAVTANAFPWKRTAENWFTGAERLRTLAARLMNARADSVALVPAVSYGIAIAAANVPVKPGQSIVLLENQFPSNYYVWQALARRSGAKIRTVQRGSDGTWTDAVLAAIDRETAVVAVPNCHWTDGSLVDLRRVSQRARAVGAAFVVDASQSLGVYPLDVEELQPDFLASVGYKWLLGPYGLAYLYAAPRWQSEGTPIEYSWVTRLGSENFSRLEYVDDFQPGARRFDMGEYSQFTTVPIATAALEQILEWGVERIQRSLAPLTRLIQEGAEKLGGTALPERHRAGHLVGIRLRPDLTAGIAQKLTAAGIYVSVRGDVIRVAPHVYNDRSDIETLLSAMQGRD